MLHASQDATCSRAVRHWNSPPGLHEFKRMVARHVSPPPRADDARVELALRNAVPRLLLASDDEVHARVADAALAIARRVHGERLVAARHRDACEKPPPPRHSTYVGASDRVDGELQYALPSNPHYAAWLRAQRP